MKELKVELKTVKSLFSDWDLHAIISTVEINGKVDEIIGVLHVKTNTWKIFYPKCFSRVSGLSNILIFLLTKHYCNN